MIAMKRVQRCKDIVRAGKILFLRKIGSAGIFHGTEQANFSSSLGLEKEKCEAMISPNQRA